LRTRSSPNFANRSRVFGTSTKKEIRKKQELVRSVEHLVAYAGTALEGEDLYWVEIHHSAASKGGAGRGYGSDRPPR
jgi:hypothetical protein